MDLSAPRGFTVLSRTIDTAPTRARGCSFPAQAIGVALITPRLLYRLADRPPLGMMLGKRVENKKKRQDLGMKRDPAGERAPLPGQAEGRGAGGLREEEGRRLVLQQKMVFQKTPSLSSASVIPPLPAERPRSPLPAPAAGRRR